jgi:hypothetical protein
MVTQVRRELLRGFLMAPLKPRLKALAITLAAADHLDPVDGVPELIDEVYRDWAKKHNRNEEWPEPRQDREAAP